MTDYPSVEIERIEDWHDWLKTHASSSGSIWVVTWKKNKGPDVPYGDLVDEALCFGWIDSLPRRLNPSRTMLLMSPRRAGSGWSTVNKGKIARLVEQGRMTARGIEVMNRAIEDGSWTRLDVAGKLEVSGDLAAALEAASARDHFDAFPRSIRRGILEWIEQAKRPETRRRRIEETAATAGDNRRVR